MTSRSTRSSESKANALVLGKRRRHVDDMDAEINDVDTNPYSTSVSATSDAKHSSRHWMQTRATKARKLDNQVEHELDDINLSNTSGSSLVTDSDASFSQLTDVEGAVCEVPSSKSESHHHNHAPSSTLANEWSQASFATDESDYFEQVDLAEEKHEVNGSDAENSSTGSLGSPLRNLQKLRLDDDDSLHLFNVIIENMKTAEMKYRAPEPSEKYAKKRRAMVTYMLNVADKCRLQPSTTHQAVLHLDRLLATNDCYCDNKCLPLAALCCIYVSAKFEEKENRIPSIAALRQWSEFTYTESAIRRWEVHVLNQLKWCLNVITPAHFIDCYIHQPVLYAGTLDPRVQSMDYEQMVKYMKNFINFFAEMCLEDSDFFQYRPSLLVAGIISTSRRAIKLTPTWNQELAALTGYKLQAISQCHSHIYNIYSQKHRKDVDTSPVTQVSPQDVNQMAQYAAHFP